MISAEIVLGAVMAIPIGIAISMIIATYYYNKNYYLETKIKYLKLKNDNRRGKN